MSGTIMDSINIPNWTTDLPVLWAVIIILVILIIVLCITLYIVKGHHSRSLALTKQYERALRTYVDVGGENISRLARISSEIDALVRDDQDLIKIVNTELAGSADPTVLAMGGPDRSPVDQD